MNTTRTLDTLAMPLDGLRQQVFRWVLAVPWLRGFLLTRDRRIGAHAFLGISFSLGMTLIFPAFLFALGPLLFGVAHVMGDLRYLLLRRSVPRAVTATMIVFCGGFILLRAAELLGGSWIDAAGELFLFELWIGSTIVAAGVGGGSKARMVFGLGVVLALGAVAQQWPFGSRLVFAHAHNVIGVGLWLLLFRRALRPILPALGLFALGVLLTISGVSWPLAAWAGGLSFAGQDLVEVVGWIAPMLPVRYVTGALLSYVFLQSIHYSVWLALIPQEDVRAEGTTSFRMSFRSLSQDLRWLLWPTVVLVLLVPLAALRFGAPLTRDVYLSLASFHGYFEVAMVGYFLVSPVALERAS